MRTGALRLVWGINRGAGFATFRIPFKSSTTIGWASLLQKFQNFVRVALEREEDGAKALEKLFPAPNSTPENDSSEILTQGLIFAENYPPAFLSASHCSAGPITRAARFASSSAVVS